jgi:hypothetical protein
MTELLPFFSTCSITNYITVNKVHCFSCLQLLQQISLMIWSLKTPEGGPKILIPIIDPAMVPWSLINYCTFTILIYLLYNTLRHSEQGSSLPLLQTISLMILASKTLSLWMLLDLKYTSHVAE